jgi:hypothetical protein
MGIAERSCNRGTDVMQKSSTQFARTKGDRAVALRAKQGAGMFLFFPICIVSSL